MNDDPAKPRVSLILCSYRNEATLLRSLRGFYSQSYPRLEIVMVDSSPDGRTAEIVREKYPEMDFYRHPERLLPHEAQAIAVERSGGELLIFSDPDIYVSEEWVKNLVSAWAEHRDPVVGAIECFGAAWLDMGLHLAKFDQWLAGGGPRSVEVGPTAALLCTREAYEEVGGFRQGIWLADTVLCWDLAARGHRLLFLPEVLAFHHHRSGIRALLNERFVRGREFARLRLVREEWSGLRTFLTFLATVLPLRWPKLVLRSARSAWRARRRWGYLPALPVAAAGHAAWLAGEAGHYLRTSFRRAKDEPG